MSDITPNASSMDVLANKVFESMESFLAERLKLDVSKFVAPIDQYVPPLGEAQLELLRFDVGEVQRRGGSFTEQLNWALISYCRSARVYAAKLHDEIAGELQKSNEKISDLERDRDILSARLERLERVADGQAASIRRVQ